MENKDVNQDNVCAVKIDKDNLKFEFLSNGKQSDSIVLKAGPNHLLKSFFSSEYPTEGEIEKALNYVEYELTKHKELKNKGSKLLCADSLLAKMLKADSQFVFTKQQIELVFDTYIDCAYGEPAHLLNIEYSQEKLATIILVRSLMYYLDYEEITVQV